MTSRTMCPHPTAAGIEFVACDVPTVQAFMVGEFGSAVDHLDPHCQAIRHRQDVRPTVDRVCPEGSDLCGSCVRRWRASNRARTGPGRPQGTGGRVEYARERLGAFS